MPRLLATGVSDVLRVDAGVVRELLAEPTSHDAVARWAADLARRLDRPVALTVPGRYGPSTLVLVPRWAPKRTADFIAGHHHELVEEFAAVEYVLPSSRAA